MATIQKGIERLQASLTEMRSVVRDMTPAEADVRVRSGAVYLASFRLWLMQHAVRQAC